MQYNSSLWYVGLANQGPWQTYLAQLDRVIPYLGPLGRYAALAEAHVNR